MGVNVRTSTDVGETLANTTITNNTIVNCDSEAILVEGMSNVRVVSNVIGCAGYACGYGIALAGRAGYRAACWNVRPANDSYVGFNTVNGAGIRNPILAWGDGPTLRDTVEQNTVDHALHTTDSDPTEPDGVGIKFAETVRHNDERPGLPTTSAALRDGAVVHNNFVQYAVSHGIFIGGTNATLHGNYVDYSAQKGLLIQQSASNAYIRSGRFRDNANGIVVRSIGSPILENGLYVNSVSGVCYNTSSTLGWNDYSGNRTDVTSYPYRPAGSTC